MARFHATSEGHIPFTAAEEVAEDARLAAVAADAPKLVAEVEIARLETLQTPRLIREAALNLQATNGDAASPYFGLTAAQTLAKIESDIQTQRTIIRG